MCNYRPTPVLPSCPNTTAQPTHNPPGVVSVPDKVLLSVPDKVWLSAPDKVWLSAPDKVWLAAQLNRSRLNLDFTGKVARHGDSLPKNTLDCGCVCRHVARSRLASQRR